MRRYIATLPYELLERHRDLHHIHRHLIEQMLLQLVKVPRVSDKEVMAKYWPMLREYQVRYLEVWEDTFLYAELTIYERSGPFVLNLGSGELAHLQLEAV